MSGRDNEAASDKLNNALRAYIGHQLAAVVFTAQGGHNGFGLSGDELEALRSSLLDVKECIDRAQFRLVRPDVRDAIVQLARERETAEKAGEAFSDGEYLGFRCKLIGRPSGRVSWNGNKKLRAEVEALYKPES
jgi:hypothetical protein